MKSTIEKIKGDSFYYYHNWRAKQNNAIHSGSCKNCNYGNGMRSLTVAGLNGVWVGPFANKGLALVWASRYSNDPLPIKEHKCCL